jgi:hypothetical protein
LEFDIGFLLELNFLMGRQREQRQDDSLRARDPCDDDGNRAPALLRHRPVAEDELAMAFGMPETDLSRDPGGWKCRKKG